jgi:glycosyltransferase involved in cell wall biosynthesis
MNILNVGTDRAIADPKSDVRARMLLYAPFVNEMHLHYTDSSLKESKEEKIADNVYIYGIKSWKQSIPALKKIIRIKHIDTIVSPDPFKKGWVCMYLAWKYKIKLLLSVYGSNIFDPNWKKLSILNCIYSWFGRIVFNSADAIQTDGLETLDILVQKYGKKIFWKPMVPANINDLLAINRESNNSNKLNVLYIGRLIEQKNIPFLVNVIKEVRTENTKFTVVGDGPMKHLLNGLDITHYEKQNREEIIERFKEADILILSSYFEGFARVIMEAALSGIPVVTTKVSGIQGIVIDTVSGYIFEQGDEKGFIEGVNKLISDANKRIMMGREIREKAKDMLSISMMIDKQRAIYTYLENLN